MKRSDARALLALFVLALGSGAAAACGRDSDCVLPGGAAYRISPPSGWDGAAPLPVALFFHGWQQTPADVMSEAPLVAAFSDAGVLLVVVEGLGRTWSFPGSPSDARDDVAVALAVLADVEARLPVDQKRVWATGFSQGASMVWSLACTGGGPFAAFVPVAGAFWEPIPTDCPAGPANLMHIHGLADGTVPLAGRAIGERFRQGDVRTGLAVWRRVDGCTEAPVALAPQDGLACSAWAGCASGNTLRFCLHPGGHVYHPEWVAPAWRFVLSVTGDPDAPGEP